MKRRPFLQNTFLGLPAASSARIFWWVGKFSWKGWLVFTLAIACALGRVSFAQEAAPSPPAPDLVSSEALELIRDECVGCHRTGKSKGGLKLTTQEGFKAGGESGPLLEPGKAAESLLLAVLSKEGDPHMPPKKQLSQKQIAAFKTWMEAGAAWDAAVLDRPPRPQPVALRPMPSGVHPVLALAFSPDGATLAVARGGSVELRDATAARFPVKTTIAAHVESVESLAWSSDGATLITGGFRRLRFWKAADGVALGEMTEGLAGDVTALGVSGGTLFVADSLACRGGFVHRLNGVEHKMVQTWKAHDDAVFGLVVSADGLWLATAGADRLARRWDAGSGALVGTYEGHTNQVLAVAFDSLAPRLATTGADREIKVWDRESREQDAVLGDRKQVTSALFWSKDGSRLVGVTDRGNGTVFSAIQKHTGEQRSETAKEQKLEKVDAVLQSVTTTADGAKVAAGATDGRFFVWKSADGKLIPVD